MKIEYCDVCKMLIKEKPASLKQEVVTDYLNEEKKEYATNFLLAYSSPPICIGNAKPSEKKDYVCNKVLCDICKQSFESFTKQWEEIRFKETQALVWQKLNTV